MFIQVCKECCKFCFQIHLKLNLISDLEQVHVLAEIGVMLLLFTIGLEFSLAKLKSSKNLFFVGGPAQMFSVLLFFVVGGYLLDVDVNSAIFWGFLITLSSTAIVLKALAERGESDSLHGRSTIGILIFQDLAIVPMMLMTPFWAPTARKAWGASCWLSDNRSRWCC